MLFTAPDRSPRPSVCLIAFLLTAPAWLVAESTSAQDVDDGVNLIEEVEAIFETAAERYAAMATYQDRLEMRYDISMADDAGAGMWGADAFPTQRIQLAFEPPNRLMLRSDDMGVYCDGEHVWTVIEQTGQYRREPAPGTFDELLDDVDMYLSTIFQSHPVVSALFREHRYFADQHSEILDVHEFTVEGDTIRIFASITSEEMGMFGDAAVLGTFELDADTYRLRKIEYDMTDLFKSMADGEFGMGAPEFERYVITQRITDIRVNEPIDDSVFTFAHEDNYELVEVFDFGWEMPVVEPQVTLIGEPAPDFTGVGLDDEAISLENLRGNVVVLDFWAMWCGPCVQALPHVQNLAERFADEPVVVLGINSDPPGSAERIRAFLDERDITIDQVLDEGDIGESYLVTGIPSMILIDKAGIVQDASTGFGPGKAEEVAASIERLLAGETLYTEEELAQMREEADQEWPMAVPDPEAEREAAEAVARAADAMFEQTPAALHRLEGRRPRIETAWNSRLVDLQGNGEMHLVVPHVQGGLCVVSPDGTEVQRLRFKGMAFVEAYEPVHLDGALHWIAASSYGGGWAHQEKLIVGLFDADGERIWRYEVEMPDDLSVSIYGLAAGDLTGNQQSESVVSIELYQLKQQDNQHFMHQGGSAYLLVLDANGNLLARHKAGSSGGPVNVHPTRDGEPGAVIVIEDGRVTRYSLQALSM